MQLTIHLTLTTFLIVSLLTFLLGLLYARLLNGRLRWLADDATELSTVIGVAGTLLLSALLIGLLPTALLFWLFGMSGISQLYRSAYNRRAERERLNDRSLGTIKKVRGQSHDPA